MNTMSGFESSFGTSFLTSPVRTEASAAAPNPQRVERINDAARGLLSTNTHSDAPQLNASSPTAPVPEQRSHTVAWLTRENPAISRNASLTRDDVGLHKREEGRRMCPFHFPRPSLINLTRY